MPIQETTINLALDERELRGIANTVYAQVRGISRDDADDAVQDAWITVAQKAHLLEPGPINGYLMRTARFKALKIRDKRRGEHSLDEIEETTGHSTAAFRDQYALDPQMHVELTELRRDPIMAQRLDTAEQGASANITPRGVHHRAVRYSDDQIAEVRELRKQGLTYVEISARTGVERSYCSQIVRRVTRLTPSAEGWTGPKVIDAIRAFHVQHGVPPRHDDLMGSPSLPSQATATRLFGSLSEATRAAGFVPAYDGRRRTPWTSAEVIASLCSWRITHQRWPRADDLVADASLPSPSTVGRKIGTRNARLIGDRIRALLT